MASLNRAKMPVMLKTKSIILSTAFLLIGQAGICADGSLIDQATKVNTSPIQLQPVTEELYGKLSEEQVAEKELLTALCEGALKNSPDINFVLSKLMPSSDHSKTVTILMKTLSTVLYTSIGSMGMIAPSQGTYMQATLAMVDPMLEPNYPSTYSRLPAYELPKHANRQLIQFAESKRDKKLYVSQAEQIMLYKMVRDTADSVRGCYYDYLTAKTEESKTKARKKLVDLAGEEAVCEFEKNRITGSL